MHPSHDTRISDASSFDEICKNCGVTDAPHCAEKAKKPCPKVKPKQGAMQLIINYGAATYLIRTTVGAGIYSLSTDVTGTPYWREIPAPAFDLLIKLLQQVCKIYGEEV